MSRVSRLLAAAIFLAVIPSPMARGTAHCVAGKGIAAPRNRKSLLSSSLLPPAPSLHGGSASRGDAGVACPRSLSRLFSGLIPRLQLRGGGEEQEKEEEDDEMKNAGLDDGIPVGWTDDPEEEEAMRGLLRPSEGNDYDRLSFR